MSNNPEWRAGLEAAQSLAPHEVTCQCVAAGEFDWNQHSDRCPRHQVGGMLAAMLGDDPPQDPLRLTPSEAMVIVGDLSELGDDAAKGMKAMLAIDARLRRALGKPVPDEEAQSKSIFPMPDMEDLRGPA